jgi:L-ascorbate metabolism protein UlaG (beta-lactamase superfamily)
MTGVLATTAWVARAARDLPAEFGGRPAGERLARMRSSTQYRDGAFHNSVPGRSPAPDRAALGALLREWRAGAPRRPARPVPLVRPDFAAQAPAGVRAVWLGHATMLVEIEGHRVLFDPVFGQRPSPSQVVGPRRLHPVPIDPALLPAVDAVVISHDHYDHLDMATTRRLAAAGDAVFVVPLGIGAHLEAWGLPAGRIRELDWDESTTVGGGGAGGGLRLTATPARHFSGRRRPDDSTLWAGWVLAGPTRAVFFGGDSGFFDGYARIGERHGPFDLTLLPVGAYSAGWPDIHMNPEEAVAAHRALRGRVLIPMHWATFVLAAHGWSEPVERACAAAEAQGVRIAVPRPGESVDPDDPIAPDGWWRDL